MTASKSSSRLIWRGTSVWPAWALLVVLAIIVSALTGERTRQLLFDAWQRLSPRHVDAQDIRVVLIDGKSLGVVGPWPWSRYYLGRLTEEINRQGPKVIGFDVLFPEADRATPESFAKLYPELTPGAATEVRALPSMDQLFGLVIGQSPVVLARAGASQGIRDGNAMIVDAQISGTLPKHVDEYPAGIAAIPELDDVALGHGLVNGPPDSDGTVRAVPLVMKVASRPMPGFALELARLYLDEPRIRVSPNSVELAKRRIPVDDRGRMQLRFGEFPNRNIISAAAVLGGAVPQGTFRDKIVLIGLAAEGTSDIVSTPLAG